MLQVQAAENITLTTGTWGYKVPFVPDERNTMKVLFLEKMDDVELGTEPTRFFETHDYEHVHSAHVFTVAEFDTDDPEILTEPWMVF